MCCSVARSQRSLKDAIGERIQLLHERRSSIQKFIIINHEQTSLSSSESIYIELMKTIRQIYVSQLFIGGTQSRLFDWILGLSLFPNALWARNDKGHHWQCWRGEKVSIVKELPKKILHNLSFFINKNAQRFFS